MKVLFLTDGSITHPSTRYRVYKYISYLEKEGIECSVFRFRPQSIFDVLKIKRHLKTNDLIFLQKVQLSFTQAFLLKRLNHRIIYDLDDAIFLKPDYVKYIKFLNITYFPAKSLRERIGSLTFFASFSRKIRPLRMFKLAQHIIVGNRSLKNYATKYNKKVSVIPTSLDLERYNLFTKKKIPVRLPAPAYRQAGAQGEPAQAGIGGDDKIIIGWMGTAGNLVHLKMLEKVFAFIGKKYKNVILKVVCDEFLDFENISMIKKKWRLENEIEDLKHFDIGIMPLIDSPYTRGKCGFKILQYMGIGVPVVASPVGINEEIIDDGVNGFTATTYEEWIEKLSHLIENSNLRGKMGSQGYQTVENYYAIAVNAPKLKAVLELVCPRLPLGRDRQGSQTDKLKCKI